MTFTASTFVDDDTTVPISAAELNKLGNGVALAQSTAEQAASISAVTSDASGLVVSSRATHAFVVLPSDSSAVTATSLTSDATLQKTFSSCGGRRIGLWLYLLFRGDFAGSSTVSFGLSCGASVSGSLYLTALNAFATGNSVTTAQLDSTGTASGTATVLSGTTAGTDYTDVYYAYGFATLLLAPEASSVTVTVVSAQHDSGGTGVKLLKGSCMVTEMLT